MSSTFDLGQETTSDLELFTDAAAALNAPIALTPPAYELAVDLAKLGALDDAVELPTTTDRSPLTELRRKGVIKTVGGTRGRPGRVALLKREDELVLSQRRRPGGSAAGHTSRPTIVRTRPTVEDLRALLAAIDDTESELIERLSAEINDRIATLKRALLEAKNGSTEERELFDRLSIEMQRLRQLESEIRVEALKRIETARGPLAVFVGLISRERSVQPIA